MLTSAGNKVITFHHFCRWCTALPELAALSVSARESRTKRGDLGCDLSAAEAGADGWFGEADSARLDSVPPNDV